MEFDDILEKEDLQELDEIDLGIELKSVTEVIISYTDQISEIETKIDNLKSEKEDLELELPSFKEYKKDVLEELRLKCNHLNIENRVCKNCFKTGLPDQMTLF